MQIRMDRRAADPIVVISKRYLFDNETDQYTAGRHCIAVAVEPSMQNACETLHLNSGMLDPPVAGRF